MARRRDSCALVKCKNNNPKEKKKEALEAERRSLYQAISELEAKIKEIQGKKANVPAAKEMEDLKQRISEMESVLSSLRLTKVKERKALKAQIEEAYETKSMIFSKMGEQERLIEQEALPLRQQKQANESRIAEIGKILTGDKKSEV